jgi:VWFA-related protein
VTRRIAVLTLAAIGFSLAQEPVIRGGVDLVDLLITVRDKKGNLVKDLEQSGFTVFEDGKQQEIRRFSRETELPLTLGMLIDVSGSVAEELVEERRAARQFFEQVLRKQDRAFVISFGREAMLEQDLTDSLRKLEDGLDEVRPDGLYSRPRQLIGQNQFPGQYPGGGRNRFPIPVPAPQPRRNPGPGGRGGQITLGGTVLYDAIYLASDEVLKPVSGRKAIILITDGEDHGSKVRLSEAIEAAQKSDTIIYSIFVKPDRRGSGADDVLERLSTETGGRMFRLERRNLDKIFAEINDELRSQYSLSYASSNPDRDGYFRKIEVRMKDKNQKAATRAGYYATDH